jgi:hypothetical protein
MDGAVAHAVMRLATSGSKSSRIADSGQSALPNKPDTVEQILGVAHRIVPRALLFVVAKIMR